MKLTNDVLNDLVIAVALRMYGREAFRRRPLMLAIEEHIRKLGAWTDDDDQLSKSAGMKSAGLAKIDWAISHLKQGGRLYNLSRARWRLP